MTIEVQLTVQDFLVAQRLHFRPKPAFRWASYLGLVIVAVIFLTESWTVIRGGVLPRGWWILPAGLAYGAFLFFLLLPWRIARIFKQNPGLAAKTHIEVSEEGLALESARGQLRFGWPMIKGWKANREVLLIYHSSSHFHTLPRRYMAENGQYDGLRELLTRHLGPDRL